MATNIVLSMDGTLLNWLKNQGDSVNKGDIIAEIEADKATVEVEAPTSGVIASVSAKPGDELKEGTVIGTIGEAGASAPAPAAPVSAPTATAAPVPQETATAGNGMTPEGRYKASPVARNMAAEKGIDLAQVRGTGPGGRITKSDVENFQPTPTTAAAPPSTVKSKTEQTTQPQIATAVQFGGMPVRKAPEGPDVEIIEVTRMRARIAANTVESKQWVPHFYVTSEINLDPLLKLREDVNKSLESQGIKVSVNDMLVKATAITLHKFPNLNTHYYGDKLVRHHRYNIGIAVALSNGGLINVVAKDADRLSLGALAQMNKEMIARAREGKVKPEDVQGSTFTTSNLGPYDVEHFIAIINPPEAGILAIGSGRKIPVVKADGSIGVETRIKITISVDHRVSDGAEGAAYLQELRALIENPMRLLV
ncbi:MAG: 2-oxo acid dehydrogenase subunit E2 [Anaerolineae bacterium]|jgi:pyruvate dehydrogenase E2 component (dihydrolipoamide acetyltransferase)|nr:2-oxo acid dehydrogenase subunit E2 [Anaerolineae bacterium]